MTDGTSQGLFIVVAIVIFGIFVSLSYTVFGNMSDGVTDIFSTALINTEKQLNKGEVILHREFREGLARGTDGLTPQGFGIAEDNFVQDGRYTLTFDIEVVSGELKALRGHLHTSSSVRVFINDIEQGDNSWYSLGAGFIFDEPFVEGDLVSFRVEFTTDNFEDPIQHHNRVLGISPNIDYLGASQRHHEGDDSVNYHNILLIKRN